MFLRRPLAERKAINACFRKACLADGAELRGKKKVESNLDKVGLPGDGRAVRQTRESVEETGGDAKGLEYLPVGRRKPVLTD